MSNYRSVCGVEGEEVYYWPEFIALARRLGFIVEARTTQVQIILGCGEIAKVRHEYNLGDGTKDCRQIEMEVVDRFENLSKERLLQIKEAVDKQLATYEDGETNA